MTLRHEGRVLRGKVIYATRKNVPHDIAVIVCRQAADIEPCRLMCDRAPIIGEVITRDHNNILEQNLMLIFS